MKPFPVTLLRTTSRRPQYLTVSVAVAIITVGLGIGNRSPSAYGQADEGAVARLVVVFPLHGQHPALNGPKLFGQLFVAGWHAALGLRLDAGTHPQADV